MSTSVPVPGQSPEPVGTPLGIRELTAALVKHYGLHEGLYDLYLEYQFAFGNFGPSPGAVVPSAVFGISKMGVTKVTQTGPLTVDASEVNPVVSTPAKKRTARAKGDA